MLHLTIPPNNDQVNRNKQVFAEDFMQALKLCSTLIVHLLTDHIEFENDGTPSAHLGFLTPTHNPSTLRRTNPEMTPSSRHSRGSGQSEGSLTPGNSYSPGRKFLTDGVCGLALQACLLMSNKGTTIQNAEMPLCPGRVTAVKLTIPQYLKVVWM